MEDFVEGTQIAYIPTHAEGNINHPDVELGFVTGPSNDPTAIFCRYWRKGRPGVLRTLANSELTPIDNMVVRISVPQHVVNRFLQLIKEGKL